MVTRIMRYDMYMRIVEVRMQFVEVYAQFEENENIEPKRERERAREKLQFLIKIFDEKMG